jgi:phosphate:Na+ symporter
MAAQGRAILELGEAGLSGRAPADWLAQMERAAVALAEQRRQARPIVLKETADGQGGPAQALEILDAMRWLDRGGYHTWRICNYLGGAGKPESALTDANPEE